MLSERDADVLSVSLQVGLRPANGDEQAVRVDIDVGDVKCGELAVAERAAYPSRSTA